MKNIPLKPAQSNDKKSKGHNSVLSLKVSILGVMLTFLGILVGIYTTRWSVIESRNLAAENKVAAKISIGNQELPKWGEPLNVIYGVPSETNGLLITELPLIFRNQGHKSINGLTLTVRYPSKSQIAPPEKFVMAAEGHYEGPFHEKLSIIRGSASLFDFVSVRIPKIDPGITIGYSDMLMLKNSTEVITETTAKSKDGYDVSAKIRLVYSVPILLSMSGEDFDTKDAKIQLQWRHANDIEELYNFVLNDLDKAAIEYRNNFSFLHYLFMLLSRNAQTYILICPEISSKEVFPKTDSALILGSPIDYKRIKYLYYHKVQFNLLFS